MIVTREDTPAKPRPEPLWMICAGLGVTPAETLMVGDFTFDILAGRKADTRTALLTNGLTPSHIHQWRPTTCWSASATYFAYSERPEHLSRVPLAI